MTLAKLLKPRRFGRGWQISAIAHEHFRVCRDWFEMIVHHALTVLHLDYHSEICEPFKRTNIERFFSRVRHLFAHRSILGCALRSAPSRPNFSRAVSPGAHATRGFDEMPFLP